jgi:hypothetical protein
MHDDCVARSKQWLSDLMNLMSVMSFGAFRGRVNSREVNSGYNEHSNTAASGQQPDEAAAAQAAAARARAPAAAAAPQLKRRRRRGGPRLAAGPR